MSIRRVGSNPFVNSANLIQSQRRIERVEKHIGAEDSELKTEEEALESLNKLQQAELDELEAERAEKAKQTESLRAQLVLSDGYERHAPEELVDLTGGAREAYERDLQALREREQAKKPGVSLAQLARASVYERVSREEKAAALRAEAERVEAERAEAERLALELAASEEAQQAVREGGVPMLDEEVLPDAEDEEPVDWMAEELALRQQAEEDADDDGDGDDEEYEDPQADSFLASLEDIENLEERPVEDPHAGGFLASLDDIENLETPSAPDMEAEAYEVLEDGALVDAEDAEEALSADVDVSADVEDVFEEPPAAEPEALLLPFDEEAAPEPVVQQTAEPMARAEAEAEAEVVLPFDDEAPARVPAEQES